ncbi:MFS transporter [Nocardia terpenica]|uniref:MFS transporter n=1 Tax=Nocardia terpenica TaxID=455432 RepID=A0A6G9Z7Q0_9NOCA|nr:MFS transporter [Nocardia terpenica]QIS21548.1 MFS transporter [Nocardia terpenica]
MTRSDLAHAGPGGAVRAVYRRTFESVRLHRNYRLFFGGQLVSQLGSWVQKVAQGWFVLQAGQAHAGTALGVLVVCQFAPYTVLGLFGGALCDRLDHHRALIVSQALSMLCAAALAALAFGGGLRIWQVDVLAVIQGVVMIVDTPLRQAFVLQLVGRAQLPNAVSLNVSVFNLARTAGPALGGIAIAALGLAWCFLVNALSFLAVLAGLLLMRRTELQLPEPAGVSRSVRGIVRDTGATFRYTLRSRVSLIVLILVGVVATLGTSFNVTLPVVTGELHANAAVLGILFSCYGIGALLGALGMAGVGRTGVPMLLWSCVALGAAEAMLVPQHTVLGTGIVLAGAGSALSVFTANASSTLQLSVPAELRVRLLALYSFLWIGTAPLSGPLAGVLSDRGGPGLVFAVAGITLAILAGFAGWIWRRR